MSDNNKKRIGIDARFYGPLGKGLGRYVQEVVDNAIALDAAGNQEFEFVIFLSPENYDSYCCPNASVKKIMVSQRWYSWREQLFLPMILKKENLDLVHFPHFNVPIFTPVPFVVTIHDLILTRFPSRRASMLPPILYWVKQAAYRLVVRTAVKRAQMIITVSKFTKDDIVKKFKALPEKIHITYEGVVDFHGEDRNNKNYLEAAAVLSKYAITSPYLLYVGNAYPHKNLERLLAVYKELQKVRPDLSLIMVGKDDFFYTRVKNKAVELGLKKPEGNKGGVVFPGYVPDAHLETLYKQALLYVFPSLYEGFGLPPLEAMSHSCPVVASNQASLPEILDEAAAYFDPYNEKEMVATILALIADENRRQELAAKGRERIRHFSWQKCAQETLDIYREALDK